MEVWGSMQPEWHGVYTVKSNIGLLKFHRGYSKSVQCYTVHFLVGGKPIFKKCDRWHKWRPWRSSHSAEEPPTYTPSIKDNDIVIHAENYWASLTDRNNIFAITIYPEKDICLSHVACPVSC